MKKIIIALMLSLSLIFSVACENIPDVPAGYDGDITIQNESPDADIETVTVAIASEIISENITSGETTSETTESTTNVKETNTVSETEKTSENITTNQTVTVTTEETTLTTTVNTTATTTTEKVTETETVSIPDISISPSGYYALNFAEQKGVWISFLEFQRILTNNSESGFRAQVRTMYDNCKNLGINTVYVHARAHGDAYYDSQLFPWSENVCGEIGVAPDFDPYEILVQEAHNKGLSFHAWINPMRGPEDEDMQKLSDNYIMKQWYNNPNLRGRYIVKVNDTWYYNPAYEEVRNLISNGIKEIISNYNVDGIHIDDYFYPTTSKSFDESAFRNSGASNLSQWRLNTVSNMVKEMYSAVKSVNQSVLFGISPAGNIENNYKIQYADVKRWASESGFMDYLVPQVYFGYNNKYQPYETNLQAWCDMVTNPDIKLVVGLAAYKVGSDEGEWKTDSGILSRQVNSFRTKSKYGGAAFFRYDFMFQPPSSVSSKIKKEMEELKKILN